MSKTIMSGSLTFIDNTDNRKLEVHISSNLPTIQIYNANEATYTPDWTSTNLELTHNVYLDSVDITADTQTSRIWYKQIGAGEKTRVSSNRTLVVSTNDLSVGAGIITYICEATYQDITAEGRITFTRVDTGVNGLDGNDAPAVQAQYSVDGSAWTSTLNAATHKYIRHSYDGGKTWTTAIKMVGEDGTSVRIKGTATSATSVTGTDYYTLIYSGSSITGAELGDAYLYNGDLYVCTNSRDGADYFINVGAIQGPAGNDGLSSYVFIRYATDANGTSMSTNPSGKTYMGVATSNTNVAPTTANSYTWSKFVGDNAKSIVLSGDSQVFKVSTSNVYMPATIKVTAQAFNTSVTTWTYSTNGGQTFVSTAPTGVSISGNVVTITGSTLTTNSLVVKASDGTYSDVFTVYKAFDGTNGTPGTPGTSASMAFLTNENVTFSANASGVITSATISTNVVAYNGTTKITPTVGTIANLPTGMTATVGTVVNNEVPIVFTVTNSNLGSALNNNGSITIPVNGPVYTNLVLSWSKVNSGATGTSASLVDITPSALYFKSTTGKDGVFTPDFIYLYPRFQTVTYNKWQYSLNGGIDWADVVSGENGLSIASFNSTPYSLRISRSSALYTDSITSISFRCLSSNASIYDTVSIVKIYDIVDFKIGGRNLLTNSGYMENLDGWRNYTGTTPVNDLKLEANDVYGSVLTGTGTAETSRIRVGKYIPYLQKMNRTLTFSMIYSASEDATTVTMGGKYSESDTSGEYGQFYGGTVKRIDLGNGFTYMECPVNLTYTEATRSFFVYIYPRVQTIKIVYCKLEDGNIATDWTPATEDITDAVSNINVMLSNEAHFFEADYNGVPTATSITLDIIGYKGSTRAATTIGAIGGLVTGITAEVSNNNTASTTITVKVETTLTANSGTLNIPITVDGYTINKVFSWSKSKAGAPGASASLVTITPSSLYFKSTTGKDGTFNPEFIYLYPRFQNATYNGWQYSTDGGITWTAVTVANGLAVGTYNSVANTLRISRSSVLYTDTITSISFKCNSLTSGIYDIVSIAKLYDVVDLQIGGRNYILDTEVEWSTNGRAAANGSAYGIYKTGLNSIFEQLLGQQLMISFEGMVETTDGSNGQILIYGTNGNPKYRFDSTNFLNIVPNQWHKFSAPISIIQIEGNTGEARIEFYGTIPTVSQIHIRKLKLEIGNKVTDWTPAPEDLIEKASNTTVMLSNEAHIFEADLNGVAVPSTIVLDVIGLKGATQVPTTVGTITGIPSTGMAVSTSNNNTTNTKITISTTRNLTSEIADYGTLSIPITINGHTINKVFSWAKSNDMTNLQIGGRNLLKWTKNLPITATYNGADGISKYSSAGTLTSTTNGIKLNFNGTQSACLSIPLIYDGCVKSGEAVTLSFDYRGNITDPGALYLLQRTSPNVSLSLTSTVTLVANETEWQHCETTFSIANANDRINYQMLLFYNLSKYTSDNWIEIKAESLKLEKGHKATSWTPAIEETGGTTFQLYAPKGYLITHDVPEVTLQTFAYDGSQPITNATFKWYSWSGENWTVINNATSTLLTLNKTNVLKSGVYKCEMTYGSKVYEATATVEDKTDIYESLIRVNAKRTSNNSMYWVLYATVYSEEGERDALLGPVSETAPVSPTTGSYWYQINPTDYSITLKKYSGTAWATSTDKQELFYDWFLFRDTTEMVSLGDKSKIKIVKSGDFVTTCNVQCNIFDTENTVLSRNNQVLNDPTDPIISETAPTNPIDGQIWIKVGTNSTYVLSVWSAEHNKWIVSNADTQNKIYVTKPTQYNTGDLWIVDSNYQPIIYKNGVAQTTRHSEKTMLRATATSSTYSDAHWEETLKYQEELDELTKDVGTFKQFFSFDDTGMTMQAKNTNGAISEFKTRLTNTELGFYQGEARVAYINNNQLNISKAEITNGLVVSGTAPTLQIGNFTLIQESNGSLSIGLKSS